VEQRRKKKQTNGACPPHRHSQVNQRAKTDETIFALRTQKILTLQINVLRTERDVRPSQSPFSATVEL